MTDIDKKIAELEELEKKSTPGPWVWGTGLTVDDRNLAVAMRNYLPELIAEIRRLKFARNDLYIDACQQAMEEHDAAIARAEKAEEELYRVCEVLTNVEIQRGKFETFYDMHKVCIKNLRSCRLELYARLEQMQAERDALITNLVAQVGCPTPTKPEEIDCRVIGCRDCWLEWATQETAKRREEV